MERPSNSNSLDASWNMPRIKTARQIELSADQRDELNHYTRATTVPAGLARRARIVLMAASGKPIREIARLVGVQRNVVRKWLDRFRKHGCDGLYDLPRPGREPVFPPRGRR